MFTPCKSPAGPVGSNLMSLAVSEEFVNLQGLLVEFKVVWNQFSSVCLPARIGCQSVQFSSVHRGKCLCSVHLVPSSLSSAQFYAVFVSEANSVHNSNYFKSSFSSVRLPDRVRCHSVQFGAWGPVLLPSQEKEA